MCHVSRVTYHLSSVTCHLSLVTCCVSQSVKVAEPIIGFQKRFVKKLANCQNSCMLSRPLQTVKTVAHGARKVSHGARKVSQGIREVSYGARKMSHGARKVSFDFLMYSTSLLQVQTLADISVLVCSFRY